MAEAAVSRTPNAQQRYEVTRDQLPVHCPIPGTTLWNSHPRVYLPVAEQGEARCPYCGAVYVLAEDNQKA
ncbi:MAG TPA: zinc-finger domain-containing protein [Gammaproteobacteria bacterium]|nr:zinc-finger domain-containing protein [Gammaproteobacteria bacterium]